MKVSKIEQMKVIMSDEAGLTLKAEKEMKSKIYNNETVNRHHVSCQKKPPPKKEGENIR